VKYALLKRLGYSIVSVNSSNRNGSGLREVIKKVIDCTLYDQEMDPSLAVRV
jgi:hypothetical protein